MIYKYCGAIEISPLELFERIEVKHNSEQQGVFSGKEHREFLKYFAEIESKEVKGNIIALLKSLRAEEFR